MRAVDKLKISKSPEIDEIKPKMIQVFIVFIVV